MNQLLATLSNVSHTVSSRIVRALLLATLWRTMATSDVGFKLFGWPEIIVNGFIYAYMAGLLISMADQSWPTERRVLLHSVLAALGTLVLAGRAFGFYEIMQADRPDLEGAVWERVAMIGLLIYYHTHRVGDEIIRSNTSVPAPKGGELWMS